MNPSDVGLPAQTDSPRDPDIAAHIMMRLQQTLDAYRADPLLVHEHANIERATAQGGYGRRQLYELIQNGADALLEGGISGRIHVVLTPDALYCANEGAPIDKDGVDAILHSHISMKRGTEIGRFGLGFKSVLGVTDTPEFYSTSGAFGFSAERSASLIRAVVPGVTRYPVLRIASPLKRDRALERDPVLAGLASWATTVIRLPRTVADTGWLSEDLRLFPAEFPLFSPHVTELRLEDRTEETLRVITLERDGDEIVLNEGQDSGRWKVFSVRHVPSVAAKADGGELADREVLPLIWAVPLQRRSVRGRFWAFFPTEYLTTLSGIVNAPWKTNEDRQNLLTGTFNSELIEVAARLIVDNLKGVISDEQPGSFLELLPGRGGEAPNWADRHLTDAVYRYAARAASLPDQNGALRQPAELNLHPAGIPRDVTDAWSSVSSRPPNWCHASVDGKDTRSRAERIFDLAGRRVAGVADWLEALLSEATAARSQAALEVAALLVKRVPDRATDVVRAKIALARDGTLVAPHPATLFFPRFVAAPPEGIVTVHPDLLRSEAARATLEQLGIRVADATARPESLLASKPPADFSEEDWELFWNYMAQLPQEEALSVIARHLPDTLTVRVRTIEGRFRPLAECLLPGPVVPPDGSRDRGIAIDTKFHRDHRRLIVALGGIASPQHDGGHTGERWYPNYLARARAEYLTQAFDGSRPMEAYLVFDRVHTPGPLDLLATLSPEGRVRYTEALLALMANEPGWELYHETVSRYPRRAYPSPSLEAVLRDGYLNTSLGPTPVRRCIGRGLSHLSAVLPVVEGNLTEEGALGLPGRIADLTDEQVKAGLAQALRSDAAAARNLYAELCSFTPPPERIACMLGNRHAERAPREVTVVTEPHEIAVLSKSNIAYLPVTSAERADDLVRFWQMQTAAATVTVDLYTDAYGEEIPLKDAFPALVRRLPAEAGGLRIVRCGAIRIDTRTAGGHQSEVREVAREGDVLYLADGLDNGMAQNRIAEVFGLNLSAEERERLVQEDRSVAGAAVKRAVRDKASLAEKLLAAVGADAVHRRLPYGLRATGDRRSEAISDVRAAELILAVFGVDTLKQFASELAQNGLEPPAMWAGSWRARRFAEELGFPGTYAGFERAHRGAAIEVYGVPALPALHEFQEKLTDAIRDLLTRSEGRRGLLSLPTGAGKTRVTVEALIRAVNASEVTGPLLWVAQSDELCEQAVQTWHFLWRALGKAQRLQINRLWGGNEADRSDAELQVVVATIQKLQGCFDDPAYDWLRDPGCVIIDEAHHATESSYTALLEWCGLGRGGGTRPLLGLTATAFRGGVHGTQRLVNRFGGYRLDAGILGDDPYRTLQDAGILAFVDHLVVDGIKVNLKANELRDLKRTRVIPPGVEYRIGASAGRNERLLESLRELPEDWPVLLFAASVDHAQTMAALLQTEGISAAAVSTYTDMRTRQHYIERFRAGEIRVLTNYAVLTTGFDAPAVRVVMVARPTYSPVLYQQMIGRGLRGPLNGGKARCLIINVADNIIEYGPQPAFRDFEYLWRSTGV